MYDYSKETPFSTFEEVVSAINRGEASLSYDRSTAYNLSKQKNRAFVFSLEIGVIFGLIVLLGFAFFKLHNYWILLFTIPLFFLNFTVPYTKRILLPIGLCAAIIPLLFSSWIWLSALGFSLFAMLFGYDIWWSITYNTAKTMMLNDSDLFEQVWTNCKVAINTSKDFGGFYTCGTTLEEHANQVEVHNMINNIK